MEDDQDMSYNGEESIYVILWRIVKIRPGKTRKPANHVVYIFSNKCKFLQFARDLRCESQKKACVRKYIEFRLC